MQFQYIRKEDRQPDTQYADRLRQILNTGERVEETPQGIGALTCFGTVPPMVFNLANGVPLITDRKIGFWRKAVAEIVAFAHGARTIDDIESRGCDFWKDYRGKGTALGLDRDDLGPGSYGSAFHDFEVPGGEPLNQFQQLIDQITRYPNTRTHLVTPWKPYYTARGENRKVIVAPCHGWIHVRILNGQLHLRMDQRSADFPIGVPSNMIQYAALMLMLCRATGYSPGNFIHSFADAHIYENQVPQMRELLERDPLRLPTMRITSCTTNFWDITPNDFELSEYEPHPSMHVPYSP